MILFFRKVMLFFRKTLGMRNNFTVQNLRLSKRILFSVAGWFLIGCLSVTVYSSLSCARGVLVRKNMNHESEVNTKPRLLILTDIGGDPDDQQSLIRLALYFNEFDMEGFIASASGIPGELGEAVTKPHLIQEIIRAYEQVLPNLRLHDPSYPDAAELIGKIKSGNPHRGLDFIGPGHETAGSEWIIEVVNRADTRPVNIAIWGGQTDLFQALWTVRNTRTEQEYAQFVSRIRIYDIADQDGILDQVLSDYPGLFYILNKAPDGADKRDAVFRGMYLGGDESLTSMEWIQTNVQKNHGPLGALYPLKTWTAPNPHGVLKEGDTPSWFYFLPTGLGHPDHPEWGGWGGRFRSGELHFSDATDEFDGISSARATVWRWRPHFQNDFQARLDWCVERPADTNHSPVAVVNNQPGRDAIRVKVSPGEILTLSATDSTDPDGDKLSFYWYVYPEAGTAVHLPDIKQPDQPITEVHIPSEIPGGSTIHIILEVTDDGEPRLTSYRRVVVEVATDS